MLGVSLPRVGSYRRSRWNANGASPGGLLPTRSNWKISTRRRSGRIIIFAACSDSIASPRRREEFGPALASASRAWVAGNPARTYQIKSRNEAGSRASARACLAHACGMLAHRYTNWYSVCANGYFGQNAPRIMRARVSRVCARFAPKNAKTHASGSCWARDSGSRWHWAGGKRLHPGAGRGYRPPTPGSLPGGL